jgi:hypothetical protein
VNKGIAGMIGEIETEDIIDQ